MVDWIYSCLSKGLKMFENVPFDKGWKSSGILTEEKTSWLHEGNIGRRVKSSNLHRCQAVSFTVTIGRIRILRVFADIPSSVATPSRMKGNLANNILISWDRDDNSWFAFLWQDIQLYFSSILFEVNPRFCHSQRSLKAQILKHLWF